MPLSIYPTPDSHRTCRRRRTNCRRSTRKANISLSVISSWTFSRYHAPSPTIHSHSQLAILYLKFLHDNARSPNSISRHDSRSRIHRLWYIDVDVVNVPLKGIGIFEVSVVISTWRARWTAFYVISPPPHHLIYIASSIDKPRSI